MTSAIHVHRCRAWPVVALFVLLVASFARETNAASASGYERYGASEGLASGEVVTIAEDDDGYLWAATFASGVHRFDGSVFERFDADDGLTSQRVKRIHVDHAGHVRVATLAGLFVFDRGHFVQDPNLGDAAIYDVLETSDGVFWFATGTGLVRIAEGHLLRLGKEDGLPDINTTALAEGPHGEVWIGTTRGLARYDHGRIDAWTTDHPGMKRDYVTRLRVDAIGQLWVATDWGVDRFDGERFHPLDLGVGDRHLYVVDLAVDRQKRLRMATLGAGVLTWDGQRLTQIAPAQGVPSANAWSLAPSHAGGLWIGTGEHGLLLRESGPFDPVVSSDRLGGTVPFALARASDDALLVATVGSGVIRVEETATFLLGQHGSVQTLGAQNELPSDYVYRLLPGRAGLWIGTKAGAALWDDRRMTLLDPQRKPWPVRGMVEDDEGRLWIVDKEQGLVRYTLDGEVWRMDRFPPSSKPTSTPLWSITRDGRGQLWLGATSGLYRFDGQQFEYWPAKGVSSTDRLVQLMFDADQRLWFRSDEALGIVEIRGAQANWAVLGLPRTAWLTTAPSGEVLAAAEDGLHRLRGTPQSMIEQIGVVSRAEGYPSSAANAGGVLWQPDGTLLFGTAEGIFRYQPDQLRGPSPARIHLRRLLVWNDPKPLPDSERPLLLQHDQNFVSVDFDGTAFPAPETIEFRYRVDGVSDTWSPPTTARTAIFPNLPPGLFHVRIQARHGGGWDSEVVSGPIRILPAYWQTWWFRAFVGGLLLIAVSAVPILRARNLAKQRDRLEQEVAQRTAELARYSEQLEVLIAERTQDLDRTYQELLAREEERNRATEAAAAAYRQAALGRLAGVVAHQVNTPLAAIKARLALLVGDPYTSPDAESSLLVIDRQVDRIARIVRELLGFVRQREVGAENLPIGTIVRSVVDLYAEAMRSKAVTVTVELPPEPLCVPGSSHDLQELVLNLVENAREAVASGGHVRIAVERHNDAVRLLVEDDGVGLGDDPERFFQAFFTTKTTGTGLGLAIARRIAEALGGTLVGENRVGDGPGARFVLTLPLSSSTEFSQTHAANSRHGRRR